MIIILIYVQPFQHVFQLGPLGLLDWAFLLCLIPLLFVADEVRKFIVRRRDPRKTPVIAPVSVKEEAA